MREYLKLMRVKHYMKNLLIFLPAVLTRKLFEVQILKEVVIGAVIFSFASSVIYIINDIRDVEMDRQHPVKSKRPLASGKVSLPAAKTIVVFLTAAVICIWGYKKFAFEYIFIPLLYLALNVAYSLKLKEYPLIDVLRLIYGGRLAGTGLSAWMFLTITAAAFFLGFGKRRNELLMYGSVGRANLKEYNLDFLDRACQMSMTTTIIFYALSCADVNTEVAEAGVNLLWSVPAVFIICLRYLMILNDGKSDGDPVEVVFRDKWLILLGIVFLAVLMILLYGS